MFRRSKAKDPFFDAFTRHAQLTVRAAGLLRQLFEDPTRIEELKGQITELEHQGDELTRSAVTRLRSQWITPLDRSDIHLLASRLDDVLDVIESTAERLLLFDIRERSALASRAAEVLETTAMAMAEAIALLPEARKRAQEILTICTRISTLESDADALYRSAIAELFQPGGDALSIMKWRDIHEQLESATDLCEDVANALEGVVLEYA